MKLKLAAAVFLTMASAGHAECQEDDVLRRTVQAARVERQANFVQGSGQAARCPSAERACRMVEAVKPGEIVLIGATQRDYTCAMANTGQLEVTGWLPASRLVPLPQALLPWDGRWERRDTTISIGRTSSRRLRISGVAVPVVKDKYGRITRGAQFGEIDAKAEPIDGMLSFAMGASGTVAFDDGGPGRCRVWMARRGPYLVVRDNNECGQSISFSGLYRRR